MSGSTYNTVLKNLDSGTLYTVTLVPIFSNGEGQRMSEDGKTCKCLPLPDRQRRHFVRNRCERSRASANCECRCKQDGVALRTQLGIIIFLIDVFSVAKIIIRLFPLYMP